MLIAVVDFDWLFKNAKFSFIYMSVCKNVVKLLG